MGSFVGFDGEDESQPSTSHAKKHKLPTKLLNDCGAVNHSAVPRKPRSAIKKRGRESITPPLPISRKQHRVSDGIERLKKTGSKKYKRKMKQTRMTKDEKEVAETLYALADMFTDAGAANTPGSDEKLLEAKSSEDTGGAALSEESNKISSRVVLADANAYRSSITVDSESQIVKFLSSGETNRQEVHFNEQAAYPSSSGVQSHLSLDSRSNSSKLDIIPGAESAIALEQGITAPAVLYRKHHCPLEDKDNGPFPPPSFSAPGAWSSETKATSGLRFPVWFGNTSSASQPPHVVENRFASDKYSQIAVQSNKSWKKCAAQVYICRLIKVLQISERKGKGLLEEPTAQLTTCVQQPDVSSHNQTRGIDGRNSRVSSCNGTARFDAGISSAQMQNDIRWHERQFQVQQLASSETSALLSSRKQCYDFLSLGGGGNGNNRMRYSDEAPKESRVSSYLQLQKHQNMLSALHQNSHSSISNGRTSALGGQQVQLPPYVNSTTNSSFTAGLGQKLEPQQHKWAAQLLTTQYSNTSGVAVTHSHIPDWKNGGRESPFLQNYGRALYPHLHAAALSSKFH